MVINKDTKICVSVASKPGNFGALVHNYCYEQFGLNYVYLPLATKNFKSTMKWVNATPNVIGCSVSMPYKKEAIRYVKNKKEYDNINTIYKIKDELWGYSTDLFAIKKVLSSLHPNLFESICIFGNGAMAKNFKIALEKKYDKLDILNHKQVEEFIFEKPYTMIINATPIGMNEYDYTSFGVYDLIKNAKIVIDCPVGLNFDPTFTKMAKEYKKEIITGIDITLLQAAKQFERYTQTNFYQVYNGMRECLNDYRNKTKIS